MTLPENVQAALAYADENVPDILPNGTAEQCLCHVCVLARYVREQAEKTCVWSQEDEDSEVYSAACHPTWLYEFNEEPDAHWTHCPYCGLTLVWAKPEPCGDEDEEREG